MYLLEHDAKEILSAHGIPAPAGVLIESTDAINASALPPGPWIVKAQVAAGGRGKAGAIRRGATLSRAAKNADTVLGPRRSGHRGGSARAHLQRAGPARYPIARARGA